MQAAATLLLRRGPICALVQKITFELDGYQRAVGRQEPPDMPEARRAVRYFSRDLVLLKNACIWKALHGLPHALWVTTAEVGHHAGDLAMFERQKSFISHC